MEFNSEGLGYQLTRKQKATKGSMPVQNSEGLDTLPVVLENTPDPRYSVRANEKSHPIAGAAYSPQPSPVAEGLKLLRVPLW